MPRCYICDTPLSSISFNRDHGDIEPCGTCLEVIRDVFHDDPDQVDNLTDGEIEPTPEEMMNDVEELSLGKSFE